MKSKKIIIAAILLVNILLMSFAARPQSFQSGGYQGGTHGSGGDEILVGMENHAFLAPTPSFLSFPNPFHYETTFHFTLVSQNKVEVNIYDVNSRIVIKLLPFTTMEKGTYSITWDGKDEKGHLVSRGIYYYRYIAGKQILTGKVVYH